MLAEQKKDFNGVIMSTNTDLKDPYIFSNYRAMAQTEKLPHRCLVSVDGTEALKFPYTWQEASAIALKILHIASIRAVVSTHVQIAAVSLSGRLYVLHNMLKCKIIVAAFLFW